MHKFYYNPETGKCQEFIYGEMSGNGNNFKSEEECRRNCIGTVDEHALAAYCLCINDPGRDVSGSKQKIL
ncbi:PI-actitoxin-Aeq3b-like [Convolutriloba macropyga]|uniref:PI-actitoxin-Aeq3b-like n=1 Tax=Convolutriloba macropyga TaxID=536237 RepID=UPI003F524EB2